MNTLLLKTVDFFSNKLFILWLYRQDLNKYLQIWIPLHDRLLLVSYLNQNVNNRQNVRFSVHRDHILYDWKTDIQWGSEWQTSLVFKWSKRGWIPNGLVFKCHMNTGQMDAILFSYVLFWYSNGRFWSV